MSDNTPDTIQHLRKKHDAALEFGSERIDIGVYELTALLAQLDAKDTEIANQERRYNGFVAAALPATRERDQLWAENVELKLQDERLRNQIAERDATIAKIQREFERTDWGARNIELTEQLNYWRQLASTRDNKNQALKEENDRLRAELQSLKEPNP